MADQTPERVDDLYFSALADEDEVFPISDEKYADHLQLQEVLLSSAVASNFAQDSTPHQSLLRSRAAPTEPLRVVAKAHDKGESSSANKTGDSGSSASSSSSDQVCTICMDSKPSTDMFRNPGCPHVFCKSCIGRYVGERLRASAMAVTCPEVDCGAALGPDQCRDVVPREVLERWESALCEGMILASERFYCPFRDCSVLLVDDGGEPVTRAVCPSCQRLFCAQCGVGWHEGLGCREYKALGRSDGGKNDLLLFDLVKSKKWKKCPNCRFYVERNEGCLHMTCRCRFQFCYGCGEAWSPSHACRAA